MREVKTATVTTEVKTLKIPYLARGITTHHLYVVMSYPDYYGRVQAMVLVSEQASISVSGATVPIRLSALTPIEGPITLENEYDTTTK